MSSILVVEQEARYVERVRDALVAEGWQVRLAASREAAFEASAAAVPALVVVAGEVAGAAELLRGFSQRVGGPGALLIAAEATDEARAAADESLGKPFTDQELRLAVRRLLASKGAPKAVPASSGPAGDARVLTSADIFGDVLAEMEGEGEMAVPATAVPPPPPLAPVPAPAPPPAAAATTTRIPVVASTTSVDVEKKLEQTLSGMLPTAPRPAVRPPTPQTPEQTRDVENLLSKTLAGLEMPSRRPEKPAPPVAKAPAPAPPTATQKIPAVAAPPAKPASEKPRAPAGPPRGAFDAQLDELTGSHRRPSVPAPVPAAPPPAPVDEIFATQRIETVKRPLTPPAASPPSPAPARPVVAPMPPPAVAAPAPAPVSAPAPAPPAPLAPIPPPLVSPPAAVRASEPPARVDEPREFGQYTLLDRIAIGGMAEVWKARMKGVEGFQKTVAIKKILPHLTDSVDFVTMFIDEAKLAAQLNHNNIIHIYDLGKIADDYYIAMEYVEGRDLRSILNSGRHNGDPLPLGLALLIAARLASALDYAHRKKDFDNRELGLVHRDVSPQNVLISYEGDIKLCDFGIVKAVAKASKTQMGALKGKLQYMSPEQSWGRSVDARSDIFSMGSVLFEMLTGRRLFAGDSEISVLEAVRECRIQAPRDVIAALPEEVNRLVMKALAKDPDDRFQSAGEMQKELEKLLYGLKPTPSQDDLGSYMQRLYGIEPRAAAPLAAAPTAAKQQPAAKPEPAPREVPAKAEVRSAPAPSAAPHVEPVVPAASSQPLESEEQEKKGRWVPIAAILALAVLGGAYWALKGGKGGDPVPPPAPAGETTTPPEGGAAPAPAADPGASTVAPTVDAAAVAAQLVEQEAAKRAAELQQQGDAEVKRLEAELARTQQAAPTPTKPTAPPAPAPKPTAPVAAPTPSAADQQAEAERLAQQQAEAERLAQQQAEAERAAQAAAAPAPTPEPAAPAPAPVEQVKVGDLVTAGLGVIPPVVVSSGRIEYPMMAKRMRVEGAVVLQVLVDENGAVLETRVSKPAAQNVGFNEAAVAAAKGFKFRPATKNGVRVKMWTTLNIPFRLTA